MPSAASVRRIPVLVCALMLATCAAARAQTGSITGTVTAAAGGAPISGMTLFLYNSSGGYVPGVNTTNASGVYTISNLTPGNYFLQTSSQGFHDQPFLNFVDKLYTNTGGITCPGGSCAITSGTPITVTAGGTTSGINFSLAGGGIISGTVTAGGASVDTATVTIYNSSGVFVGYYYYGTSSGSYSVPGLPTGTYYATASLFGFVKQLYSGISCPGVSCSVTSGTAIGVTAGSTALNVNFSLVASGTITGTVTKAIGGTGISGLAVQIFNSSGTFVTTASTNASGNYTAVGLAAGNHFVRTSNALGYVDQLFNGIPCSPTCTVTSGTAVTVTGGATTPSINFSLAVIPVGQGQGPNFGTFSIGQVEIPLAATNGTGPYTWSLAPGSLPLPPGLSLRTDRASWFPGNASSGIIGVATSPGTYTFTLRVSDANAVFSDQICTLKISPLAIKDLWNLPEGFVGVPYTPYTLTALGNTGAVTWTVTGGSLPGGSGLSISSAGVLSGTPTTATNYNGIHLSLFDAGTGDTVTRDVNIFVNALNIATPGVLPNAVQGAVYGPVTLTAGGGSGTGYTFTRNGSFPSDLTLSPAGVISGTIASFAFVNNYQFSVRVTDSLGASYSKNMSIDLVGVPPTLPSIRVYGNFEDCSFGVNCGRALGVPSGGRAPFVWSATGLAAGMSIRSGSGLVSTYIQAGDAEIWGTPTQLGLFNVQVTVTDADLKTVTNVFTFRVSKLYQTDYLVNGTFSAPYLNGAVPMKLRVIGGTLPYTMADLGANTHLPAGLSLNTGTFIVGGTPAESGNGNPFRLYFRFTDSSGSPDGTFRNTNYFSIANPSTLDISTNSSFGTVTAGSNFSNQLSASGAATITWSLLSGSLPTGTPNITLSSSGLLSGTPTAAGSYAFTVKATDSANSANFAQRQFTMIVTPMSLTSNTFLPNGFVGVPYSSTLVVTGATGAVTWTVDPGNPLPPGFAPPVGGVLSGTPTQRGQYTFSMTGADTAGHIVQRQFTISIYLTAGEIPLGLSINNTSGNPSFNAIAAGSNQFGLSAGGGTPPYHYSVTSGAVPGFRTLDGPPLPTNFAFPAGYVGVATTPGVYNTVFRVTDSLGAFFERTATFTVVSSIVTSQGTLPKAAVGVPYGPITLTMYPDAPIQTTASGIPNQVNGWGLIAGSLPPGVSLSPSGVLAGTPSVGASGYSPQFTRGSVRTWTDTNGNSIPECNFTNFAANGECGAGSTTNPLRMTETLNLDPFGITTSGVLPQGVVGTPYPTTPLTASNCGTGCTWFVSSGSLPSGLTLNGATGAISGTPTGAFNSFFTVSASGSNGTASKVFSLLIANNTPGPLTIATGATQGYSTIGAGVATLLSASGGTPPYAWSIQSGTPPPGVTLQGPGRSPGCQTVEQTTGTCTIPLPALAADATLSSTTSPGQTYLAGRIMGLGVSQAYDFTVAVTDGAGRTATKAIHWLVTPLALAGGYNNLPLAGTVLRYGVPYTQPLLALGGTGVYTFANTTPMPPGLTLSAAGVVDGTPTNTGSFNTSVQVTDDAGSTTIVNVSFNISAPPPATQTIALGIGITQTIQRGSAGNVVSINLSPFGGVGPYTITALDPLPPGFAILTGDATLANNGAPSASYFLAGTPLADGVFVFRLRVQDSGGINFGVRTITLTVAPFHLVTSTTLPDASVGVAYSQQLQAWDNSGPVTWALAPTSDPLPPGMTLSSSGLLSGPPTAGPNTVGTYSPTINMTASGVTVSNRFTLRVSNVTITNAPVMPTGQIGVPYGAYTFTASGGAGPITWSATGLPSGLTLSPTTGALTGTPTSGGTSNIVVTATDGVVPFSKRFGLIIRGANPPVNLTSGTGNLGDVVLGQNLIVTLNVSGGMPPYTWTVAPGSTLPPGLNLLSGLDLPPGNNPTATVLAGAPSIAGAYTFDLIATDGVGEQVRRTLTLHVSPVAIVGNLTGNFQNVLRNPTTGVFYSQRVTAVGGTGPYTFTMAPSSLVNDMLPPGLNLSADGVISGTATSTGVYTFVLTVHDASGQTFARTFTVTVANSSGLFVGFFNPSTNSFNTVNPPDTWVGSARSYTDLDVSSLSGPVNMYAWSLAPGSGPLPPGISVVPSDDIFGGPSLGGLPTSPGTYVYTLRATDTGNAANFVDHTFTQRIAPMQIATPPMGFLGLIFPGIADLPPAQVGVHYSFLFRMAGGTGPFTFTESPFAPLPAGLNLSPSGVLSGTPVSPGGYLISPIVTDAAGYALNVNTTLIVTTPGVPVAMNVNGLDDETLTPGAVGEAYNLSLNDFVRYGVAPFTWSLASGALPPGLSIVNGSGGTPDHLAGTPTTAGEYAFALMVSDSNGQSIRVPATGDTVIGVGALRLAPPALPDGRLALPDGVKGKPYGPVSLVASNGTPPYQYHLMPGFSDLPVGLTLDPATGVLSGTPTSAGNFVVIVYAIDAAFDGTFDHIAYRIYRVTIANPAQELRNSDFDGDGKRDVALYRSSEGKWYVLKSSTNTLTPTQLGGGTDILVQGDYDGDGQADWAVYHPTGQWEVLQSSTGTTLFKAFGLNTDIPVPGDYDGDGKTDFAIFRPSTGTWYYLPSSTGSATPITAVLGSSGDVPVPGDYDGDGRTDAAIYRSSTGEWLYIKSGTGLTDTVTFGGGADRPVPRDYDGDGKTDIAVYHPTGLWSIRQSSTGVTIDIPFGLNTDVPVPGDYDGDGLADLTIYRPSEGKWYIRRSTTGTVQAPVVLGQSGDRPLVGGLPSSTSSDATRARDIDGDRKADLMVYRPSEGKWYTLKSSSHYATALNKIFGLPTDTPVLGDWDGDGRTDFGVYHRTGQWEVLFSSTGYTTGTAANFGLKTDRPVPGDYDGDGRTDYAVYRPSNNTWFVLLSSTNYTTTMTQVWGVAGDVPVPGDYDADGQADFAVYRRTTGTWVVRLSATGTTLTRAWGGLTDVPVPGDYDGDGKTDLGVYHLTGQWEVLLSGNNYTTNTAANFGLSTDIPKPGDYDGDGRTDYAVWRPVTGQWFILLSSTNYTTTDTAVLGLPTDQAVPGANFSGAIVRTDATRAGDYDGDGQRDVAVYTPAGGWVVRPSSTNYTTISTFPFGTATDKPVPGDYDGDGRTDYAIFRPSDTTWYAALSSTNFATLLTKAWGLATDLRVPGDYDGDGKTDIAVYHTGVWQILKSSTNFTTSFTVTLGTAGDLLVPGDYDGDGKTDVGVYRPSEGKWYLLFSSTNYASGVTVTLGVSGDVPVPGDYDGDGKTDVAVYHTSGQWEAWLSSTNFTTNLVQPWGASTDVPAPADYDGDGQVDFAIYRPSESQWYILLSTTNYTASVAVAVGTPLIDLPLPPP